MEKKYQVFVSSTYSDLQNERKEVIQALLELDCIPVGMELFPAADEDQWTFIRSVIDDCDYYLVILAGRYGSCRADGMGYTEMEYRHALESKKPIIAFLHQHPENLPAKQTEQDPGGKRKLKHFTALVKRKLCKYWSTPAELGAVVGRSIVQLKKRSPAVGWVRADLVPEEDANRQLVKLRKQVDDLKEQLQAATQSAPPGTEDLSQGDETFMVHFKYEDRDEHYDMLEMYEGELTATWNELFSSLAPHMVDEASEPRLKRAVEELVERRSDVVERYGKRYKKVRLDIHDSDFQTIKVQLKSVGLICMSLRKRSLKDGATYWTLTPYGEHLMTTLRALKTRKRSQQQNSPGEGKARRLRSAPHARG